MIIFLLWVVAIGVAATIAYMIGRLLLDCYRVIGQRRYDKSVDQLAPLWRDTKVLAILAQVVFGVVVGMVFWYLWGNFRARTDAIGLNLNFDFLDQPAGITIADNALTPADTVGEAITAGFYNTLRLIVIGIPLAVILGTLVGIARLSSNWLMRKLATGYVEFFRNIPPLVVILFIWSGVVSHRVPPVVRIVDAVRTRSSSTTAASRSRRSRASTTSSPTAGSCSIALIVAGGVVYWRTKVVHRTGAPAPPSPLGARDVPGHQRHRLRRARRARQGLAPDDRRSRPRVRGRHPHADAVRRTRHGPRALHRHPHRRDRPRQHPGRPQGPGRSIGGARPVELPALPLRHPPAGDADRVPAAHQPVPELLEEHVAGDRDRLRRDDIDHLRTSPASRYPHHSSC